MLVYAVVRMRAHAPGAAAFSMHLHLSLSLHGARVHTTEKCTWDRECYECGGMHAARMCRKKKDRTTRTTQFGGGAPNKERRNSV